LPLSGVLDVIIPLITKVVVAKASLPTPEAVDEPLIVFVPAENLSVIPNANIVENVPFGETSEVYVFVLSG